MPDSTSYDNRLEPLPKKDSEPVELFNSEETVIVAHEGAVANEKQSHNAVARISVVFGLSPDASGLCLGCHCWLAQECFLKRHCWASQQWHPHERSQSTMELP